MPRARTAIRSRRAQLSAKSRSRVSRRRLRRRRNARRALRKRNQAADDGRFCRWPRSRSLRINSFPTIVIIDRSGKIVYRAEGYDEEGFAEQSHLSHPRGIGSRRRCSMTRRSVSDAPSPTPLTCHPEPSEGRRAFRPAQSQQSTHRARLNSSPRSLPDTSSATSRAVTIVLT